MYADAELLYIQIPFFPSSTAAFRIYHHGEPGKVRRKKIVRPEEAILKKSQGRQYFNGQEFPRILRAMSDPPW